jgi:hypothetical protein
MVYQGRDRRRTIDLVPLRGDRAGLELFVFIDDSSTESVGSQLDELRQFILNQPSTTAVGVAYMANGGAQVLQAPTSDHAAAAKVLRLPVGNIGASSSPFFSMQELLQKWPQSQNRREILMITSGIDRYWGAGPDDPYVSTSIEQAQRQGVQVFAIYAPGVGHYGHSYWRTNWGQNYLSQMADESGGESYYIGFNGPAVSFAPFLEDLTRRLGNQYLVTFGAKPEKKAGLQSVRVRTEVPNAELAAPDRVWVPAGE